MELRANGTDRVCTECGKVVGDWVVTFAWGGQGICLCQEHHDVLRGLLGGPIKLPEKKKASKPTKPKREIY